MNINNISNATIHKLTRHEIGELDLVCHGVMTYKGELKKRRQGFRVEIVNDWQVNFIGSNCTVECIKIQPSGDFEEGTIEWAFRIRRESGYDEWPGVLFGIDFFR